MALELKLTTIRKMEFELKLNPIGKMALEIKLITIRKMGFELKLSPIRKKALELKLKPKVWLRIFTWDLYAKNINRRT